MEHAGFTNLFVAGCTGSPAMNLVLGEVVAEGGRTWFRAGGVDLELTGGPAVLARAHPSRDVIAGIHPEHLEPLPFVDHPSTPLTVRVDFVELLGGKKLVHATAGSSRLLVLVDAHRRVAVGQRLGLAVPMERLHLFDPATGDRLVSRRPR